MFPSRYRSLTRILDRDVRDDASASDRELLERFARSREEAAFAALVKRYGGVVQQVCQRLRLDEHAAEDVFQSTFLVLAKQADHLVIEKSLGALLHKTAYWIAVKARRIECRRRERENAASERRREGKDADVDSEIGLREIKSMIDRELATLSDQYRIPIVLHYLEGKSREEAAEQLRMNRWKVSRRIDRGLAILRRRLAKRGCELSAMLVALALGKAEAAVPTTLATATAKSAILFVQGTAPASTATLLASSTLTGLGKLEGSAQLAATIKLWLGKSALVLITGSVLTLTGVSWWEASRNAMPLANLNDGKPAVPSVPELKRVTVRGVVRDEAGRPLPNATVTLLVSRNDRGEMGQHDEELRRGQADKEGRFTLEVPADFPFWVPQRGQAKLLASAPGLAARAAAVTLATDMPATEIRLRAPGRFSGRLVDKDNRPAAGVAVHVVGLGPVAREGVQGERGADKKQLPGWPQTAVTNAEGRFELAALDPRHSLSLEVQDDRFARQRTVIEAPAENHDLTIKLAPLQWLEGQVLAADTGKPLPNARLSVVPCEPLHGAPQLAHAVDARADANGHFRVKPLPGAAFKVLACAPESDPYLELEQKITWKPGMARQQLTLALPRGIPVRGRVIEADTGKPVDGAEVHYGSASPAVRDKGREVRGEADKAQLTGKAQAWTGRDGRFFVPALPGRGFVRVMNCFDRYLLQLEPESRVPGAATAALDLPANSTGEEVQLVVKRAGRLQGKILDRTGRPVNSGLVLTAGPFGEFSGNVLRRFAFSAGEISIPNAHPDCAYPVVVLDRAHEHAAAATRPGMGDNGQPAIRLEPCGSAYGRLLTEDGEAFAAAPLRLRAVLTFTARDKQPEEFETEWYAPLGRAEPAPTDDNGRFALPTLVAGVRYRLYATVAGSRRLAHEFTVTPGQSLALPTKTAEPGR